MTARPIRVTAFVDWNAQLHNTRALDADPRTRAKRTLEKTARVIGRFLARHAPDRFHVVLRLYHGWHKGWEPTENFRAMISTVSDTDFLYRGAENERRLLIGRTVRTHIAFRSAGKDSRSSSHPPAQHATAAEQERAADREDGRYGPRGRDLLEWARRGSNEWALVLSEDDDVVPPLFTAEAWIRPHGGRAFIVRASRPDGFLKLHGLLMDMNE